MRMIFLVLFALVMLRMGEAESSRCLVPSVCTSNGLASPNWREISLDSSCQQQERKTKFESIGSITNPGKNCHDIIEKSALAANGQYFIKDDEGNIFLTYCDMTIANGGWTLIASVHENNMKGRCTAGDRWSSEQGNSVDHPHGDGFWENRAVHGAASSATSDDYKSPGYFTMNASDVMIWHVPNDTPLNNFSSASILKYHSSNGFLQSFGGNMQTLFRKHYPIRNGRYEKYVDNGPAIPITWDTGDNETLRRMLGSNLEVEAGFIQFRAINYEKNVFALCPGARFPEDCKDCGNAEHICVGSTSNFVGHENITEYCGDFSAMDWTHQPGMNADEKFINSAIFIFYR